MPNAYKWLYNLVDKVKIPQTCKNDKTFLVLLSSEQILP